jgi:hypothetical protein
MPDFDDLMLSAQHVGLYTPCGIEGGIHVTVTVRTRKDNDSCFHLGIYSLSARKVKQTENLIPWQLPAFFIWRLVAAKAAKDQNLQ